MLVEITLEGPLKYRRSDRRDRLCIELPQGATVLAAIHASGVPWDEVGLAAVNGKQAEESLVLHAGDRVTLMAPLAGG
ncbi:MAG: MoaD/ThiS family protein [Mycobacterium leprae]